MNDQFIQISIHPHEPSQEEIREYAQWLGADVEKDQDLFYIAREALLADLPPDWKIFQRKDGTGEPFFFNTKTNESVWDHPLDKYYKELFQQEKDKKKLKQDNINYTITPPIKKNTNLASNGIKLTNNCLLTVPFEMYENDFTFIVNGSKFTTSKIVADIISPTISKIHHNDPTFDHFEIKTTEKGDFNYFLNLVKFESVQIPVEEINFVSEIVEILGQNSIKTNFYQKPIITIFNVLDSIKSHEKFNVFYENQLDDEIDFLASHFYEICSDQQEKLKELSLKTIECVISNPKLVLKTEDQLLKFVNDLYSSNRDFSILYDYINFLNVSSELIFNFLSGLHFNDLNCFVWDNVSVCLRYDTLCEKKYLNDTRYINNVVFKQFLFKGVENFNGIIRNFSNEGMGKIEINSSSVLDDKHSPQNVIDYRNNKNFFSSDNLEDSWISFNFKEHPVVVMHYTIQCDFARQGKCQNPKSWVIEGSNDGEKWSIIDDQSDVVFTNPINFVHTFSVQKVDYTPFKLVRLRMIGKNWGDEDYLQLGAIEFYGNTY